LPGRLHPRVHCRLCAGGAGVAGEVSGSPAKGWGGIDGKQDGWSVRDRGGGTSSPSPSAPPPVAISPRSSTWGDPGEEPGTVAHRLHPGYGFPPAPPQIRFPTGYTPDTAAPLISPRTDPAPGRGRGRSAAGAGGAGDAGEVYGSPAKGWGGFDGKQDGWSVRDRGGGTSSPSPSAPPPVAISPRSSTWGDPGEEPGTVAHRLHPGYGCSPDIASTDPAPSWAGEERRRRGRGGGCRQKCTGILCRRRGRGAGEKQDGWSVRDRGGGTSSPSPSAPPPVAISPRSSARGDPGEEPGTVAHRLHPGYGFPPAPPRARLLP